MFNAMRYVIFQHLLFDTPKRGTNRRYLRDDIDAVTVFIDHFGQTADLALDSAKPFLARCLDVISHEAYIPLLGMGCKRTMENSMTKVERSIAAVTSKSSGCGCSSKATAAPQASAAKSGCCGGHDHSSHRGGSNHHSHGLDDKAVVLDPVCGMSVDPATSEHRFDYRSATYHFCSAGCQAKFAANPKQYLDNSKPKAAVAEGTIYTCPMHPQIRQTGPGNCPNPRCATER